MNELIKNIKKLMYSKNLVELYPHIYSAHNNLLLDVIDLIKQYFRKYDTEKKAPGKRRNKR